MSDKTNILIFFKLLTTAFFWGGTFVAARIIAGDIGPFSAAFLRFTVASLFLVFFCIRKEGRLPLLRWRQFLMVVLLGMTGVFFYNVFFFKGLKLISAGRASLIIANNPVFIAVFSALLFKERLTPLKSLGILISITGAAIVISRGDLPEILRGGIGLGEIYVLGCVASWIAYSLIGKRAVKELSPLVTVAYAALIGGIALFFPACAEGLLVEFSEFPLRAWLCIFYLGFFGTVCSFVWYYDGIKEIGATRASQFINFVPVSAIILAFLVLGEPLSGSLVLGAVFVVTGVYLTNRPGKSA